MAVFAVPTFGQITEAEIHHRDKPADAAELSAIADRGKAIAAYDAAAWHATDAVQALQPKNGLIAMYIGSQTSAGWKVAFGKLNPSKDAFLLAFESTPTSDINHPSIKTNDPVVEDRGQWLEEARAFDTARNALPNPGRPYNGTVLHASADSWFVYFYPAQTIDKVFPTGGDVRYRVSADGRSILETHKMHASILENDLTGKDNKKTVMTFHTAVLDDAPEDMDVANVLMEGGIPMMIAGRNFVYRISESGTPVFLMTTKALQKINEDQAKP